MKRRITYRTHTRLKKYGTAALCLALAVGLIWSLWMVWLGRFVVYAGDGVYFDFDRTAATDAVEVISTEPEHIEIYYNLLDETPESTELQQFSGYYATIDDLVNEPERTAALIRQLPPGSTVMLELKSIYGLYLYSSHAGSDSISTAVDVDAVDSLIDELVSGDYYVIARMASLRDRAYGLTHTSCGLASVHGAYLWYDDSNCYWLDPTKAGTVEYLMEIADEIEDLGFDEIVFSEFRFPNTDSIVFTGSRYEALANAARELVELCSSERFAVSFQSDDPTFPLPEGRSRLYLTGVEAADAAATVQSVEISDPEIRLVFLTETSDTRFNTLCSLRPLR